MAFGEGTELAGGRYRLEHKLGSGGMATVWLAEDLRLARRVAIKIPSEAILADQAFSVRFEREARTAAALSHPHLVPVYDYGYEDERPYLVSEHIDGWSLAELRQRGRPPVTAELAATLLEALAHIHAAGIVHRDIKPGNVLVDRGGRILLTDFGIAQSADATGLTSEGLVVGTPTYLAPELKRGGKATPASDLYSLGVLLSEQYSPEDPDRIGRLIDALTATAPADRPADAEAAQEILERRNVFVTSVNPVEESLEPTEPIVSRPLTSRPKTAAGPGAGRMRALVIGLAALVVAAVATIALASGDGDGGGERRAAKDAPAAKKPTTTTEEVSTTTATTTATPTATTPPPESAPSGDGDVAQGIALNNEGYALLQQGDVAGALPKLRKSVASFPSDSTQIDYAYALFNYAQALRMSGDPEAAIPLLEKRLSFSDFKLDAVKAELAASRQAAAEG